MTALADPPGLRPAPGRRALLWCAAAAAAALAHAGVATWILHAPTASFAEPPAAAVMIELAPAPTSPEAAEPEVAPDVVDQAESLPAPPDAPPPPDAPLDPPPLPEPPPAPAVEPVVETPPVIESAEVALPAPQTRPLARPEELRPVAQPPEPARPEPPQAVTRTEPAPEPTREPPREQRRRAASAAAPAAVAAAPTSGASGASASPARWQARLAAHLERRKRYPPGPERRRDQGIAHVAFTIDGEGNVLSARIASSSGHPELDAEVLALMRRASPVPAPPPDAPRQITAPIVFQIR